MGDKSAGRIEASKKGDNTCVFKSRKSFGFDTTLRLGNADSTEVGDSFNRGNADRQNTPKFQHHHNTIFWSALLKDT